MNFGMPNAGANRAQPLGFALQFLVCSHQVSGRSAGTFGSLKLCESLRIAYAFSPRF